MKPKREFAACDNKALGKFIKRKYGETFGLVFLVIGNQITRLATIALLYGSGYLCGGCFAISIFDAKAPKRDCPRFLLTHPDTLDFIDSCVLVKSMFTASLLFGVVDRLLFLSFSANMRWLLTRDLWHRLMALLICLASSFDEHLIGFDLLIIIFWCRVPGETRRKIPIMSPRNTFSPSR